MGSRGDPIRRLVAEIIIFTYRSAGGGEWMDAAARLCGVVAGGVDDEGIRISAPKECLWTGFIIVGRTDEKVLRKRLLGV